jgi:isopenicillin-N epimerase
VTGRDRICDALGIEPPAPDAMLGAMAAVPLPEDLPQDVKARLYDDHRIEVPVSTWPVDAALEPGAAPRACLLRISAQAYNDVGQFEELASALRSMRGSGVPTAARSATAE